MCVPNLFKIDWEMAAKNPRWPPRNVVFLTFQHQTAVISRASSRSPCFSFCLFNFRLYFINLKYILILPRAIVACIVDIIIRFIRRFAHSASNGIGVMPNHLQKKEIVHQISWRPYYRKFQIGYCMLHPRKSWWPIPTLKIEK